MAPLSGSELSKLTSVGYLYSLDLIFEVNISQKMLSLRSTLDCYRAKLGNLDMNVEVFRFIFKWLDKYQAKQGLCGVLIHCIKNNNKL